MNRRAIILLLVSTGAMNGCQWIIPYPVAPSGDGGLSDAPGEHQVGDLVSDRSVPEADCLADTIPCGDHCCKEKEVCLESGCTPYGDTCDLLWPCQPGFYCDEVIEHCLPIVQPCEVHPPAVELLPQVDRTWSGPDPSGDYQNWADYDQVMTTPIVANLTDDNFDGEIDRQDRPDIAFIAFSGADFYEDGLLWVIDGSTMKEHLAITDYHVWPRGQLALGDIDNDQLPEIIACAAGSSSHNGVIAFEHDGAFKWQIANIFCRSPAVTDLEGDGRVEVLSGCTVLDGPSGTIRWQGAEEIYDPIAVDFDENGTAEVLCGSALYSAEGKLRWQNGSVAQATFQAVADLDLDGQAEIILVDANTITPAHVLWAIRANGTTYWGPVEINQDADDGFGGPPLVANLDDDPEPEIGVAGRIGYSVFEHDGQRKWMQPAQEYSSGMTGSSAFDFAGDGQAEVIYADELYLRIFSGATGNVRFSTCNTSGTLQEYPVVVDVDNDGQAEVVAASNNTLAGTSYCDFVLGQHGIRVLEDIYQAWVPTRRIWNQHAYQVAQIDEDGRVPTEHVAFWKHPSLNTYRMNIQPDGLFNVPDLSGSPAVARCTDRIEAAVVIKNIGANRAGPQIPIALYALVPKGNRLLLTTATTKDPLLPGQSTTVSMTADIPPQVLGQNVELLAAIDDDGTGKGTISECREQNNQILLGKIRCPEP